ncbi:MAG: hypothetical protein AAFS10_05220 [Myxococcota bacterium]
MSQPDHGISRVVATMALTVAMVVVWASEVQARGGPFLEGIGGLGAWTLVETSDDSRLDPGYALGATVGIRATTWLSAELTWLARAAGDLSGSSPDGADPERARSWRQHAYLVGVRYEPWRPVSGLRLGLSAGMGLTFLDIRLESEDLPLQEAEAFAAYLSARASYTFVAGLYAAADLRFLYTPTWQDASGAQTALDDFEAKPLWLTVALGYRFDLY